MTPSINQQQNWPPSFIGGQTASSNKIQSQELAFTAPSSDPIEDDAFSFFGDGGFSFSDLIDIVNPLQHIPVVSTFYRETTGDEISAAPRMMGSTLFFGPLGFASALANVVVEENTGMDIGEHMTSWVTPDDEGSALAFNETTPPNTSQPQQLDPNDPVLAWARQEYDWTRRNNPALDQAPHTKAVSPSFPDAEPFMQQEQPWASLQDELASAVTLSADSRSASWAYEAAANLHSFGRS